jgi:hypothetical protein
VETSWDGAALLSLLQMQRQCIVVYLAEHYIKKGQKIGKQQWNFFKTRAVAQNIITDSSVVNMEMEV